MSKLEQNKASYNKISTIPEPGFKRYMRKQLIS